MEEKERKIMRDDSGKGSEIFDGYRQCYLANRQAQGEGIH